MNVPTQFSKIGVVAGTEGFEVMESLKTGSVDMQVAQEKHAAG